MTTLAEHISLAGAENRPPMIEKSMYNSWASRIRLFINGKKNGRMMLDSIDEDDCDVQATNIILHGLPPDVYALVNHQEAAKDIWDRVKLLMKGTELSYQERECRLYNLFDKFASIQGEKFQHERHANEVRIMHERYPDPLALVANSQTLYNPSQSPQHLDFGLAVPTFQQGEDPTDYINKAMAFQSAMASRFPPSNNQLRTGIATTSKGNYAASQAKVVKCYNYLVEGHMSKQCTQPNRPRSSTWFKKKLMLVEAQEAGQILDEEQLAFIADPGIAEVQVAQQTIPQNSAFQTKDFDAYDSDCDDISSTNAVLMANLSSCDSDVLSEVPYSDTYPNDMINQDLKGVSYSEHTHIDNFLDNEITSDSNIISYSQYLQESQDAEQAFWLKHSNYNLDTSVKSHTHVRIEAPSELPKVSLVNKSLKKLKYHLTSFDKVVKKRTTSDAISADAITEVQTVFNQIEAAIDQCSVGKNTFEIQIKQLSIDNDQLLKQIMSQEIVHIAVNSIDILDVNKSCTTLVEVNLVKGHLFSTIVKVLPVGFDPPALVVVFTPVEVNRGLLEYLVLKESVCLRMFLKDATSSENLTFLSLFIGVTSTNFSQGFVKLGHVLET
nr:hypothetical protein [Tanacetum cinerariifolium]